MRKGEQTRAAIVDTALDLAARDGLEGLTIGLIAERMGMSKSGVFAHFGAREDLQIAVLKAYEQRFVDDVLRPALREPRGLPRLRAIFRHWVQRVTVEVDSGCLYISGAVEFDDRPGAIRDELVSMLAAWQKEVSRAVRQAIEVGHLAAGTEVEQIVFELHGIVLALHHDGRLMRSGHSVQRAHAAFERLMASHAGVQDVPAAGRVATACHARSDPPAQDIERAAA